MRSFTAGVLIATCIIFIVIWTPLNEQINIHQQEPNQPIYSDTLSVEQKAERAWIDTLKVWRRKDQWRDSVLIEMNKKLNQDVQRQRD